MNVRECVLLVFVHLALNVGASFDLWTMQLATLAICRHENVHLPDRLDGPHRWGAPRWIQGEHRFCGII